MMEKTEQEKEQNKETARTELRVVSDRASQSYCSVLKSTRIKKGLSLKDVSDELKIPLFYLEALEAQLYEKLPADIFATGYIRSYAGLLGLNPEGLIKDFRQDKAFKARSVEERLFHEKARVEQEHYDKEPPFEQYLKQLANSLLLFFRRNFQLVVLSSMIALFLLVFFLINLTQEREIDSYNSIEQVRVESADGSVLVSDIMDNPQISPMTDVSKGAFAQDDRLKVMFSGMSWVTVRNARNELIHQSRKEEGDVLELSGESPFYLRLSKASSVSILLNDEAYSFEEAITEDDQLHDFPVKSRRD